MTNIRNISLSCLVAVMFSMLAGCARMGQPDGGWYDETPPVITGSSPADRSTGVKSKKVTIRFNEFIKLEDATNKVVVSPPQIEAPDIKAAGKKIEVTLRDSLIQDVTYTIDFSDAISDNNENNPMGNYTYSFSTGERIDTFEVSGTVLDASNLEPVKGILVGLYDELSDTVFRHKPLLRVSRTDSRGRFVIKGVAPGKYQAYALQDMDANYHYSQKSEMLAFSRQIFEPSARPDMRQDTIWRDSLHIDSIARTGYTHFYPDDITLLAFTVPQTDRYLIKTERLNAEKISLFFTYGNENMPELRGLNFNSDDAFVIEASEKKDTIHYWLKDTALINRDTLEIELKYLSTDSTGMLAMRTDTIEALPKVSFAKRQKQIEKDFEKWQKEQEKLKKKDLPYDSVMPQKNLEMKINVPSSMAPDNNVYITSPTPLARIDTAGIHLYSMIDSVWYRSRFEITRDTSAMRTYILRAEWRPEVEYSIETDSMAFEDIYGMVSKPTKNGVRVMGNDNFSTLGLEVSGAETDTATIIVQLLNSSDAVQKKAKVINGIADFFYIQPGTYYIRAFIDRNNNGKWDTGDYDKGEQPEEVFYYSKPVECKAKWDVTLAWQLRAVPLTSQKPSAITKQKPDKERKQRSKNAERARNMGITYTKGL